MPPIGWGIRVPLIEGKMVFVWCGGGICLGEDVGSKISYSLSIFTLSYSLSPVGLGDWGGDPEAFYFPLPDLGEDPDLLKVFWFG